MFRGRIRLTPGTLALSGNEPLSSVRHTDRVGGIRMNGKEGKHQRKDLFHHASSNLRTPQDSFNISEPRTTRSAPSRERFWTDQDKRPATFPSAFWIVLTSAARICSGLTPMPTARASKRTAR